MLLITFLLLPILCLYTYSYKVGANVIYNQAERYSHNQLVYFSQQISQKIDEISTFSNKILNDPNVQRIGVSELDNYEKAMNKNSILSLMNLQLITNSWHVDYSIYSVNTKEVLSNQNTKVYDPQYLEQNVKTGWVVHKYEQGNKDHYQFDYYAMLPKYEGSFNLKFTNLISNATFNDSDLIQMLDNYKSVSQGDPFFFFPDGDLITNSSSEMQEIRDFLPFVSKQKSQSSLFQAVIVNNQKYQLNIIPIKDLDFYLVDYIPTYTLLAPVTLSRNLFYLSVLLLLIMSLTVVAILYRNVQIPIKKLVSAVSSIKRGVYSTRVDIQRSNICSEATNSVSCSFTLTIWQKKFRI
jgi:two-component system, sensor histidine kinase YesM